MGRVVHFYANRTEMHEAPSTPERVASFPEPCVREGTASAHPHTQCPITARSVRPPTQHHPRTPLSSDCDRNHICQTKAEGRKQQRSAWHFDSAEDAPCVCLRLVIDQCAPPPTQHHPRTPLSSDCDHNHHVSDQSGGRTYANVPFACGKGTRHGRLPPAPPILRAGFASVLANPAPRHRPRPPLRSSTVAAARVARPPARGRRPRATISRSAHCFRGPRRSDRA